MNARVTFVESSAGASKVCRPVILGIIYAAATPMALAIATATVFAGTYPLAALIAVVISAPVAVGVTLIFGVPLYFAYRRLGITSLFAYLVTGLLLSLPVAAWGLWDEYYGGYLNAKQALLQHAIEIISLISGPAATAVFWSTVRPDLADARDGSDTTPNDRRLLTGPVALGAILLSSVAVSAYSTMSAPRAQSKLPLKTEYFSLDSTKSADLIASLNEYASSHSAHLGYYFMPKSPKGAPAMPPVLIMANLQFRADIQITVTNAGRKGLSATIYSGTNRADGRVDQIWSDFVSFLRPAVERANSLPSADLPNIPWRGEGGVVLETHWWDWRFHRK